MRLYPKEYEIRMAKNHLPFEDGGIITFPADVPHALSALSNFKTSRG